MKKTLVEISGKGESIDDKRLKGYLLCREHIDLTPVTTTCRYGTPINYSPPS